MDYIINAKNEPNYFYGYGLNYKTLGTVAFDVTYTNTSSRARVYTLNIISYGLESNNRSNFQILNSNGTVATTYDIGGFIFGGEAGAHIFTSFILLPKMGFKYTRTAGSGTLPAKVIYLDL